MNPSFTTCHTLPLNVSVTCLISCHDTYIVMSWSLNRLRLATCCSLVDKCNADPLIIMSWVLYLHVVMGKSWLWLSQNSKLLSSQHQIVVTFWHELIFWQTLYPLNHLRVNYHFLYEFPGLSLLIFQYNKINTRTYVLYH